VDETLEILQIAVGIKETPQQCCTMAASNKGGLAWRA
jgi:hypothetical protein